MKNEYMILNFRYLWNMFFFQAYGVSMPTLGFFEIVQRWHANCKLAKSFHLFL